MLDRVFYLAKTTYPRRITDFASTHSSLDQPANRLGNPAVPGAFDLFAPIAFGESEAHNSERSFTL